MELMQARKNVKSAIQATTEWRDAAYDDYAFVKGRQWSEADTKKLKAQNRPVITINRCRPIINLLCGYAAQNETEPDFLPRSEEDDRVSRVAKGITKYTLDRTNYQSVKKAVFKDKIICGQGFYWLSYDFDYDKLDGTIRIERVKPFDIFIDPECETSDLSDAEWCGRYSWESPEKLKQLYKDKTQEIDSLVHEYDESERELEQVNGEPLWWSKELKKVRVVQYWYKEYVTKKLFETPQGVMSGEEVVKNPELMVMLAEAGVQGQEVPCTEIRYMTFAGTVVLEEGKSPYEHKRFPLVRDVCYNTGVRDELDDSLEPAGIIRDIKDVQRELNKNRSQRMHVVNQQSLGVRFWQGQLDDRLKQTIRRDSAQPGANIFLPPNVDFKEGMPAAESIINMDLENQANNDFYSISGITPESLSGSIGAMSGKAIDLRQSVTTVQTAEIFDRTKEAEKQLVRLLWGEKGRKGLIPQFYNEEKAMRILGKDGEKEFVQIQPGLSAAMEERQQVDAMGQPVVDNEGNPVTTVLYDLSKFDFDIVITTSQASATARLAMLYQLLEAKKSGVDIPTDIILDFMDFPEKETVKQRLQQQAQQPRLPEMRLSGQLDDLPAEALSTALQSIGVTISPQQILAERLAAKGRLQEMALLAQQNTGASNAIPQEGAPEMT